MRVSVIIPAYNAEKTIGRCVESVLNQTLRDIEVIVVNDGSEDGTLDILNSFADERLIVISQGNSGQGYARNRGMDAARGEYIAFTDADDTIEERMLENMCALADERGAEMVQCNLTDIYPNGTRRTQLKPRDEFVEIRDNAEYTAKYLARCVHSYEVCNKIFRRDFLLKYGLKFEDTRKCFSEDILFNMEAAKYLKRVCFCGEAYYNYLQNSESHMHKNSCERLIKMLAMFEKYISKTDGSMKNSASFLASMVTLYNVGACGERELSVMAVKKLRPYIRSALRSRCGIKRRLFLTAELYLPMNLKLMLTRFLNRG